MKSSLFYFDSSALVKRYIDEPESEAIEKMWPEKSKGILTASITYAEIYSVFYRLQREGRISKKDLTVLIEEFEKDWKAFGIIEFNVGIREKVPEVISKVTLRGADLIHVCSALFLKDREPEIRLVTFDSRMKHAADDLDIGLGI